ncbi:MAG: alanyl-tRNA editing protein [Treponema sp.]|jgi:alanyl-tRNA synthetase|nr:alanyl-tRNA editing protein [Treponema sp.]
MRTERLYYTYASAEPFTAQIGEIRPLEDKSAAGPSAAGPAAAILLDKTIFYPEGGGQDADRGSINGVPLLNIKETADGAEILHIVSAADAATLKPGPAVLLLDARRRRDLTVQHTAQHLLSGTILRLTGEYTVSMHLGAEWNTIDVDTPEIPTDTLTQVEDAVADAIESNAPVIIHLCPPEDLSAFPLRKIPPQGEELIRVVEIAGNDFSPCCGTHCKATGEIGILRILGAEKYKGMTRVTFIAGRRVLAEARALRQNGETISRALKIPVAETGAGVLSLLERSARLERDLKALEDAAAEERANALLAKSGAKSPGEAGVGAVGPIAETYDLRFDDILRIGRAAQKKTAAILLLASRPDKKFAGFCSDKKADLRPLLLPAMEQFGGKGGGGPGFFQGVFETPDALEKFIGIMV